MNFMRFCQFLAEKLKFSKEISIDKSFALWYNLVNKSTHISGLTAIWGSNSASPVGAGQINIKAMPGLSVKNETHIQSSVYGLFLSRRNVF